MDSFKVLKSEICLIGDEDKYVVLRVFEFSEDILKLVALFIFESKLFIESEEDSWVDF